MFIRNVQSYALEIAATTQLVPAGETVEVDDELGQSLLEQESNWQPADAPAPSAPPGGGRGGKPPKSTTPDPDGATPADDTEEQA